MAESERKEKTFLKKETINGTEVTIPTPMEFGKDHKYFYINNTLYALLKKCLKEDESFQYFAYAWIQDGEKFVRLNIRVLGNDGFKDRIFVSSSFFKTEKDTYTYLTKRSVKPNGKYAPYIQQLVEIIRKNKKLPLFMR